MKSSRDTTDTSGPAGATGAAFSNSRSLLGAKAGVSGRLARTLLMAMALVLSTLAAAPAQGQEPSDGDSAATAQPAYRFPLPFDEQPYRVKILVSFSNDSALTARLRDDVQRQIAEYSESFVGAAWRAGVVNVSDSVGAASADAIAALTDSKVASFIADQDKVFVLGVRAAGDRFLLAAREYDVYFSRWSPLFQASVREPGAIARDLIVLAGRTFSPLAKLESGDTKRVTIRIKAGKLPAFDPRAIPPDQHYKPSVQFSPNGTLYRPFRVITDGDTGEVVEIKIIPWTFYEVDRREGAVGACKVATAVKFPLATQARDANDPELIAARSADGTTQLRIVERENATPLAAMDIEYRVTPDGAAFPIGTTDLDGAIQIPQDKDGLRLIYVYVRHGRDLMAMLPMLPGAGVEPDQPLRPDEERLNIEGRVMAVQERIIDEVARRKIYEARIRKMILPETVTVPPEKKWLDAHELWIPFKALPNADVMNAVLDKAKEEARKTRDEEKWTPKIKRMFDETKTIITLYFDADTMAELIEEFEFDIKNGAEEANVTLRDPNAPATPATPGSTPQPPSTAAQTPSGGAASQ